MTTFTVAKKKTNAILQSDKLYISSESNVIQGSNSAVSYKGLLIEMEDYPEQYKHYVVSEVQFNWSCPENNYVVLELFAATNPEVGKELIRGSICGTAKKEYPMIYVTYPWNENVADYINRAIDSAALVYNDAQNIKIKFLKYIALLPTIKSINVSYGAKTNGSSSDYSYNKNGTYPRNTKYPITLSQFSITYTVGDKALFVPRADQKGGFIDFAKDIPLTFSCEVASSAYSNYSIKRGVLYYREKGNTAYNTINFEGNSAVIPTNTLQSKKQYEIYATCISDDGQSANTAISEFTTEDQLPSASGIAPINVVTNGLVTFRWNYSIPTGTEQKAYDIQISANALDWTTVQDHIYTSVKECSVKINAGEWFWRIRGYNQNDIAGSWSEVYKFINNTPPDPPQIIKIRPGGRPGFDWTSADQIAYEYKLIGDDYLFESGIIYGTEKNCLINDYIKNGNYHFQLRVFNAYGHSSEWVSSQYSQAISLTIIFASAAQKEDGIYLSWYSDESYPIYYVLRNGIPIAKTNNRFYLDRYCNGENQYIIRGVTANDLFSDGEVQAVFKAQKTELVTEGKTVSLSQRINAKRTINYTVSPDVSALDFIGRKKPVHSFGTAIKRAWSITCKAPEDIEELIGKTVYLRSPLKDRGFVVITGISAERGKYGDDTTISLEETDYQERIDYEL